MMITNYIIKILVLVIKIKAVEEAVASAGGIWLCLINKKLSNNK